MSGFLFLSIVFISDEKTPGKTTALFPISPFCVADETTYS
ncbi:hypothetical protein ANH9381_0105 [Aggregatibacter actinomycetemcomitans ANH9381]|nr:hypothetical protein ANH9381_0105 [Aggregatibacter actinomycetemcomitans ANH9381]